MKIHTLKGKLVETPETKRVGKKNTPLTILKIAENEYKKEGDDYVISDTNFFDVQVWGDKAIEAELLEVGSVLDFSHYRNEGEDFDRFRAKVGSYEWEYKGKKGHKPQITAFDFSIINND